MECGKKKFIWWKESSTTWPRAEEHKTQYKVSRGKNCGRERRSGEVPEEGGRRREKSR